MNVKQNHYATSKVKKGVIHFLTGKGITAIASFLVAILLIRELSIESYAVYTTLSALLLIILLLSNVGLERVIPKYIPELRQFATAKQLMVFSWLLCRFRLYALIFVLVIFVFMSELISTWFNFQFSFQLLLLFSIYVVGFVFSMHLMKLLQALLLQKQVVIGLSIEWFLKLFGLLGVLYFYGKNSLSLEQAFLIISITVWLGVLYFFWSLSRAFAKNDESSLLQVQGYELDTKKVFSFAMNNYFETLLGFHTLPPTSKLIGASFLAAPSLAALGFAYAMVGIFKRYLPVNILLSLVEPVIMARYSETKNFTQTTRLVGVLLKLNVFLIIPLSLWFYMSSEGLISFISNNKYGDSGWLIGALLVLLIFESQRTILTLICNAVEQSALLLKSNLFSLWFFPIWLYSTLQFGLEGLMFGLLLILVVRNIYLMYKLKGVGFGFNVDLKAIVLIVLLAVMANMMGLFLSKIYLSGLSLSLGSLVVSIFVYFIMAYLFKPFSKIERDTLNGFIGKKMFIW